MPMESNVAGEQGLTRTLVMKFGGTSVGNADAMAQAAQIVKNACAEWPRVVVVTSALAGVTNTLLESAVQAARGNGQVLLDAEVALLKAHSEIIDAEISDAQARMEVLGDIK